MNLLAIICLILWLYLLTVFHRGKMHFFKYLFGSVGVFIFMSIFIQPTLSEILKQYVTSVVGILGKLTGLCEAFYELSIVFIPKQSALTAVSLYIDYECSGIIEMMAFVSLLIFYQVYDVGQRIILCFVGCVSIFVFNVIRIMVICAVIYQYGSGSYYIAHTILGRLVFYVLTILLYYYVFTRQHIIKQKIGGFHYAEHNEHADE
jgi:exosortase family protein XrtG